jgi:hypothetical protein
MEFLIHFPYGIILNKSVTSYWIQSGRPVRLSAMIENKTLDFIEAALATYLKILKNQTYTFHLNP